MPLAITATLLERENACVSQVVLFRRLFGEGPVTLSKENITLFAGAFSWNWCSRHLLTPMARARYNVELKKAEDCYRNICAPARLAYDAECAKTWALYDEARSKARTAFNACEHPTPAMYRHACEKAWAAYDSHLAPIRDVYNRACAIAWEAYDSTIGPAFLSAYLADTRETAAI